MNVAYFEFNYREVLILTHIGIKNNKMLFDSKDWIIIASLISNTVTEYIEKRLLLWDTEYILDKY